MKESYQIYGTLTCGYCERSKILLDINDIEYTYTDITNLNGEEKVRLMEIANKKFQTVPQIFQRTSTGLEYVGGYTELDIKINGGLKL